MNWMQYGFRLDAFSQTCNRNRYFQTNAQHTTIFLREPQHTPGAYPRHPQGWNKKMSFIKCWLNVPVVCWKILTILCCVSNGLASIWHMDLLHIAYVGPSLLWDILDCFYLALILGVSRIFSCLMLFDHLAKSAWIVCICCQRTQAWIHADKYTT